MKTFKTMKNTFESPETMAIYAEIDYRYHMLEQMQKSINKRSNIEKMVDEATGYDRAQTDQSIGIIQEIIELKEQLGIDQTEEREEIEYFKKFQSKKNGIHNK